MVGVIGELVVFGTCPALHSSGTVGRGDGDGGGGGSSIGRLLCAIGQAMVQSAHKGQSV